MGIFDWFKRGGVHSAAGASEHAPPREVRDPELPFPNELFERFAAPWYTDADWARTQRKRGAGVRPDAERIAAKGTPTARMCDLTDESATRMVAFLRDLARVTVGDEGRPDLDWVAGFDQFHDRKTIAEILSSANPADRSNRYAMACLGFGTVLGEVLIGLMPGSAWLPSSPIWESSVYDPQTGMRINVFDWAVKKMSEYGVDDGYAMKVKVCAGLRQGDWAGVETRASELSPRARP